MLTGFLPPPMGAFSGSPLAVDSAPTCGVASADTRPATDSFAAQLLKRSQGLAQATDGQAPVVAAEGTNNAEAMPVTPLILGGPVPGMATLSRVPTATATATVSKDGSTAQTAAAGKTGKATAVAVPAWPAPAAALGPLNANTGVRVPADATTPLTPLAASDPAGRTTLQPADGPAAPAADPSATDPAAQDLSAWIAGWLPPAAPVTDPAPTQATGSTPTGPDTGTAAITALPATTPRTTAPPTLAPGGNAANPLRGASEGGSPFAQVAQASQDWSSQRAKAEALPIPNDDAVTSADPTAPATATAAEKTPAEALPMDAIAASAVPVAPALPPTSATLPAAVTPPALATTPVGAETRSAPTSAVEGPKTPARGDAVAARRDAPATGGGLSDDTGPRQAAREPAAPALTATEATTNAARDGATSPAESLAAPAPAFAQLVEAAAQAHAGGSAASHAPPAALSGPVEVTVPTPALAPEFREALGVQVSVLARDGVQQAELHLNPSEMGPISVRIALDGNQAQVDFGVDSAQTRALLESGMPELASALREAGLTLTGGGVSQHERGAAGGRPGEGRDQQGRPDARRYRGDGGPDDPAPTLPRPRSVRVAGGVDLYA